MSIIELLIKYSNYLFIGILSIIIGIFVITIRSNQKLKDTDNLLTNNIKELNNETNTIITVQEKEDAIDAKPFPTHDDIDEWLQHDSEHNKS
jgi:hypothetical protein